VICYVKMVILEKKMQNDKRDSLLSGLSLCCSVEPYEFRNYQVYVGVYCALLPELQLLQHHLLQCMQCT
jgi:hypothetical protein